MRISRELRHMENDNGVADFHFNIYVLIKSPKESEQQNVFDAAADVWNNNKLFEIKKKP